MNTQYHIDELIKLIEDQKFDPEPQYDAVLSNISIAEREMLLHYLKLAYAKHQV